MNEGRRCDWEQFTAFRLGSDVGLPGHREAVREKTRGKRDSEGDGVSTVTLTSKMFM